MSISLDGNNLLKNKYSDKYGTYTTFMEFRLGEGYINVKSKQQRISCWLLRAISLPD